MTGIEVRVSGAGSDHSATNSATALQTVWPGLAKFRHFGEITKSFGHFWGSTWHNLHDTLENFMLLGKSSML